jgi:hypothetical protein
VTEHDGPPIAGPQFNIAQFAKVVFLESSSVVSGTYLHRSLGEGVCKKRPAVFTGGPSQGGNAPGAGSDSGDHRSLHIADGKVECIDESQFGSRLKLFATPADIRQGVDDLPGVEMVQ